HYIVAQGVTAQQCRDIYVWLCVLNRCDVTGEARILKIIMCSQLIHWVGGRAVRREGHWTGADAAIADNDGSNALRNFFQHIRCIYYLNIIVCMDVDKSWRQM